MKSEGKYLVAVRQDGKNHVFQFKTKSDRAGFIVDLKRLGAEYATSEMEDPDLAKLKAESKATGYSVKQLRAIRRWATTDDALDKAEYCAMYKCERAAHDNR